MTAVMRQVMLAAVSACAASAALADTVSTTGSTTIVQPVTIAKSKDLVFGRIVKPAAGSGTTGTVTLPNDSDTVGVTTGLVALAGTTNHAAYTITGEGGQTVTITVPASFNMTSGAHSIAVNLDPDLGTTTVLDGSLGSSGTAALNIGGSFEIDENTSTGAYSGTFNVAVNYQ